MSVILSAPLHLIENDSKCSYVQSVTRVDYLENLDDDSSLKKADEVRLNSKVVESERSNSCPSPDVSSSSHSVNGDTENVNVFETNASSNENSDNEKDQSTKTKKSEDIDQHSTSKHSIISANSLNQAEEVTTPETTSSPVMNGDNNIVPMISTDCMEQRPGNASTHLLDGGDGGGSSVDDFVLRSRNLSVSSSNTENTAASSSHDDCNGTGVESDSSSTCTTNTSNGGRGGSISPPSITRASSNPVNFPPPASSSAAPSSSPTITANCKLFVGGLSWETTQDTLREYFNQFGPVSDVLVMRDPLTQKSRGFGFITFATAQCVDRVLCHSSPHVVDGKQIDPKHATPKNNTTNNSGASVGGGGSLHTKSNKIFVGGVSQDTTENEIKEYFNGFGVVQQAVMLMDQQTKRHRGFGFVTFQDEETVETVCKMHFHTVKNKKVECKRAQPKENVWQQLTNTLSAASAVVAANSSVVVSVPPTHPNHLLLGSPISCQSTSSIPSSPFPGANMAWCNAMQTLPPTTSSDFLHSSPAALPTPSLKSLTIPPVMGGYQPLLAPPPSLKLSHLCREQQQQVAVAAAAQHHQSQQLFTQLMMQQQQAVSEKQQVASVAAAFYNQLNQQAALLQQAAVLQQANAMTAANNSIVGGGDIVQQHFHPTGVAHANHASIVPPSYFTPTAAPPHHASSIRFDLNANADMATPHSASSADAVAAAAFLSSASNDSASAFTPHFLGGGGGNNPTIPAGSFLLSDPSAAAAAFTGKVLPSNTPQNAATSHRYSPYTIPLQHGGGGVASSTLTTPSSSDLSGVYQAQAALISSMLPPSQQGSIGVGGPSIVSSKVCYSALPSSSVDTSTSSPSVVVAANENISPLTPAAIIAAATGGGSIQGNSNKMKSNRTVLNSLHLPTSGSSIVTGSRYFRQ